MEEQQENLEYYEIDLMDYVKVIFKRKKWIFWIFLLAIASAFVLTTITPDTYQTKAVLRIGKFGGELLEKPNETVTVLKQQSTLKEIAKKLEFEKEPQDPAKRVDSLLDFESPEKSNLVIITAQDSSPKLANEGAKAAANLVIERHKKLFSEKQELLEEKIKNTKQEIDSYQKEVETLNAQIKRYRNAYSEGEGLALQGYLASLRVAQNRVDSAKDRLNNLQSKKTNSKNTEMVAEPTVPQSPEGAGLKLTLAIAGVLGIFVGVFWVFLLEWWESNKQKLNS